MKTFIAATTMLCTMASMAQDVDFPAGWWGCNDIVDLVTAWDAIVDAHNEGQGDDLNVYRPLVELVREDQCRIFQAGTSARAGTVDDDVIVVYDENDEAWIILNQDTVNSWIDD